MARMGLSVVIVARVCHTVGCGSGGAIVPTPFLQQARTNRHMHLRCIRVCYNTTRRHHGSLAADNNKQHVDQGDRRQIDIKRFERVSVRVV